ncbi:hypothetical protein C4D60_Mb08t33290 [Musa balbisiana]|uniref:Tetrahydrofolate dehydrogenase/cyclohydrolase catalytic domain-containing protein n=1 Tax=Musa balbisiana TaxID=52838 RepID=A0A4S8K8D2_MUSBA|nr:hypothetical protein C4D60_Mb08t33290 [Musa balbisiana]
MKPSQMPGESSWGHEVKRATMALVGSLTQKLRENSRSGTGACRRSVPGLAVVIVGVRKDSQSYVSMKRKSCAEVCIGRSMSTSRADLRGGRGCQGSRVETTHHHTAIGLSHVCSSSATRSHTLSMATIIDGKAIARSFRNEIADEVPGLAVVIVGVRKDSQSYVSMKRKSCAEVCIRSIDVDFPEQISGVDVVAKVHELNDVKGIKAKYL